MSQFYPSMAVNLRLRFDEALRAAAPSPDSVDDLAGALGVTQALQPLLTGPSGKLSQVLGLVPRACQVDVNGYRQASKFALTLEWRDLPIDPRLIRAIGIEIYLDAVDNQNFARGVINPTLGRRVSIVQPDPDPVSGNQVFVGTADEISTDFSDKGMIVHLEGRNLVGILIDLPFSTKALAKLKHNLPISKVIEQVISFHPLAQDIAPTANPSTKILPVKVVADDFSNLNDFPDGEPILARPGDLTRPQMGADGASPTTNVQGDPNKISFWDIITQYCFLVGVVPYFIGETLHLRPARKLYELKQSEKTFVLGTSTTPFRGGLPRPVDTGVGPERKTEQFAYRRMVYGKNLFSLNFDRKLGGRKPPVVICYSFDPTGKTGAARGFQPVEAQWPDARPDTNQSLVSKQKVTSVSTDGKVAQTDIIRIPVPGIANKDRLRTIAHHLYEEISRQEIGGKCSTKDLASFGGDNSDPDLVKMRTGDAVEIRIAALATVPPIVNSVNNFQAMSFEAAVSAVAQRVGDENLARVIVATARDSVPELQRTFRVGNIKYAWAADAGLGIDFDFQNYVEVRNDTESQTDAKVKAAIQNVA